MTPASQPTDRRQLNFVREIKRKFFHLLLSLVPLLYFVLPDGHALLGLIIATSLIVVLDLIRPRNRRFNAWFLRRFRRLIRRHEREHLLASTSYVLSALVCVLVFDRAVALAALTFLVLGDTAAAVVGRYWGRHPIGQKTVEGSLACFVCCLFVGFGFVGLGWVAVVGALSATVAEAMPAPFDDNIRIPILSALVMQTMMMTT